MIYKRSHLLFVIMIFLALVGLISMLVNNPMALLTSLVITAAVIGFFLLVLYVITGSRTLFQHRNGKQSFDERRAYMKAVKYSQRKYGKKQTHRKQDRLRHPIRRRHAPHLTVIEGKKGKKKDRALH